MSIGAVTIIGAGQAGAQTVMSLRQWGFAGSITLIGAEPVPPYQRPPLSKDFMKGEVAEDRLYFKPAAWYEDHQVDLVLSTEAVAIDRAKQVVEIEHGGRIDYDALVIATGSRPRSLPVEGADLKGVFDLRSLTDVERIKPMMVAGRRLVIVGGGYIGLEAAASARQMGLDVTVLEMAERLLARVTSPLISEFFADYHAAQGVSIRTGARLAALRGKDGEVAAAELADGEQIDADLVLIGIGIVPNQELAEAAGLPCDDGIVVDRDARTEDPRIFAAGDCSRRPLVHYGDTAGRLESAHNAIEQGRLIAATILDRERPTEDCPWFWSNQYDIKLQIAGLSHGYDEYVVRGDRQAAKFAACYFKNGRLIATDAVNSPLEFMVSKKLIVAGGEVAPELLADNSVTMKEIAAQTLG